MELDRLEFYKDNPVKPLKVLISIYKDFPAAERYVVQVRDHNDDLCADIYCAKQPKKHAQLLLNLCNARFP